MEVPQLHHLTLEKPFCQEVEIQYKVVKRNMGMLPFAEWAV